MSKASNRAIEAIVKMQGCTTKPGRRAFVGKGWQRHGIAAGVVRYYAVIAPTWSAIRRAIADYDTTGGRTMGFSGANENSVESWRYVWGCGSTISVIPKPLGWRPAVEPEVTA